MMRVLRDRRLGAGEAISIVVISFSRGTVSAQGNLGEVDE
jgi:hypothetical protein